VCHKKTGLEPQELQGILIQVSLEAGKVRQHVLLYGTISGEGRLHVKVIHVISQQLISHSNYFTFDFKKLSSVPLEKASHMI
jgi:hypothetical protein